MRKRSWCFLAFALAALPALIPAPAAAQSLADIQHIVIIYQENRSFDHLYGHFPGANGLNQAPDSAKVQKQLDGTPYPLLKFIHAAKDVGRGDSKLPATVPNGPWDIGAYAGPEFNTRDLVHRFYHHFHQIDGGSNDHFVAFSDAGELTMGYYDGTNLPEGKLAQEYTLCDNYFQAAFGGSILNWIYLIAARGPQWADGPADIRAVDSDDPAQLKDNMLAPDGYLTNNVPSFIFPWPPETHQLPAQAFPTIGDELSEKQVNWRWYAEDMDAALADPKGKEADIMDGSSFFWFANYGPGKPGFAHIKDLTQYEKDIKNGTLASVVWIKNDDEHDEHPFTCSVLAGQQRVMQQVNALRNSPYWKSTLVIITYDEFGGWWDHVPPPRLGDGHTLPGQADRFGPGSRIPCILAGPFARKHHVSHIQFDTTSILKLIESRYGLKALSTRDAAVNDMAQALDLKTAEGSKQ
jgi:phospholipase C